MKTTGKILASAIAVAVGLSSAFANPTTNGWWAVDFESGAEYTEGAAIAGVSQTGGAWSKTSDDASIMTNANIKGHDSYMGKLDTQGGALIWTPDQGEKPVGSTTVLINTKVYMVGSEDAPAASTGTVQTEVFLTNVVDGAETTSYLCAHVGDGLGGSTWVQLEGVNVTIEDQNWIDLRIEIDYDQTTPQIAFYVDSIQMTSDGTKDKFDVLPSGASQTTVNDVTFMGTGYIDEFIGKGVVTHASGSTFDSEKITGGGQPVAAGSFDTSVSNQVTAEFDSGTTFIQMTGPAGFVRTARVTDGKATFNTAGLPVGTYTITAYYGTAPSVIPTGYKPAAEAVNGSKAADVIVDNSVKKIAINVAPVSGLYYTLFAGPDLNSLTAGEASVLATPDDQDTGALQIKMPVPTTANEVKIIKIYASDEFYEEGDDAP